MFFYKICSDGKPLKHLIENRQNKIDKPGEEPDTVSGRSSVGYGIGIRTKSDIEKQHSIEENDMIKIYGMPTCPYCDYIHEQIQGRENEFQYINIGENIRNMGAFTRLRDSDPAFDHSKEIGDVGIPAFVLEDGSITLDPADVGLIEYGTPGACSIDDHKNGRKGC